MSELPAELLSQVSGAPDSRRIRLERWFPAGIEEVWAAITEADRISQWFTGAEVEPALHGTIRLAAHDGSPMMEGTIRAFSPPELFEYFWVDDQQTSIVRFELHEERDGTRLTLTEHFLTDRNTIDRSAGWQMYVERLGLHVVGEPCPLDKSRFHALRAAYEATLGNERGRS